MRVYKSVIQNAPTADLKELIAIFIKMINHCVKIGRENAHNRIKLNYLCYKLYNYDVLDSYKLCKISGAGVLSNREQSIKCRKVRILQHAN